jgi:macrodomain Ter protein organizer (MatP/YcbG family)
MRRLRKAIFLPTELWERIARIARRNKRTIVAQLEYWSEEKDVNEKESGQSTPRSMPVRDLRKMLKVTK